MKRFFSNLWQWLVHFLNRDKTNKTPSFLEDDEREFREEIRRIRDGLDDVAEAPISFHRKHRPDDE